jgi:hypothetical protein
MVQRSIYDQMFQEIQAIHLRLDEPENSTSGWNPTPLEFFESKLIPLTDEHRIAMVN